MTEEEKQHKERTGVLNGGECSGMEKPRRVGWKEQCQRYWGDLGAVEVVTPHRCRWCRRKVSWQGGGPGAGWIPAAAASIKE